MSRLKTIAIASILSLVLILAGGVSFDSSSAHDETNVTPRNNPLGHSPKGGKERDPFLLPSGIYPLSKEGRGILRQEKVKTPSAKLPQEIEAPPLKLKAILISDHVRLATIGSQIVGVGDKIDGETVLEIRSDRVVLGRGDEVRTLHLPQSPLKLTIESPVSSPRHQPGATSSPKGEDHRGIEKREKGGRP